MHCKVQQEIAGTCTVDKPANRPCKQYNLLHEVSN
jgi:hypothetical protein